MFYRIPALKSSPATSYQNFFLLRRTKKLTIIRTPDELQCNMTQLVSGCLKDYGNVKTHISEKYF